MSFTVAMRCCCLSVLLGSDSTFLWDDQGFLHSQTHCEEAVE